MIKLLTCVTAAVVLATAAPAAAQAQTSAPNTHVRIVFVGGYSGVVVSTGAVNAVGLAQEQSTINADGTFFGTLTFTFPLGMVVAPFTGFITSVTVEPATCTGRFTTVGTFTIASGTGAYAGMTGSGSFTEEGTFNSLPTGPGTCDPQPLFRTILATEATATISRTPSLLNL